MWADVLWSKPAPNQKRIWQWVTQSSWSTETFLRLTFHRKTVFKLTSNRYILRDDIPHGSNNLTLSSPLSQRAFLLFSELSWKRNLQLTQFADTISCFHSSQGSFILAVSPKPCCAETKRDVDKEEQTYRERKRVGMLWYQYVKNTNSSCMRLLCDKKKNSEI